MLLPLLSCTIFYIWLKNVSTYNNITPSAAHTNAHNLQMAPDNALYVNKSRDCTYLKPPRCLTPTQDMRWDRQTFSRLVLKRVAPMMLQTLFKTRPTIRLVKQETRTALINEVKQAPFHYIDHLVVSHETQSVTILILFFQWLLIIALPARTNCWDVSSPLPLEYHITKKKNTFRHQPLVIKSHLC